MYKNGNSVNFHKCFDISAFFTNYESTYLQLFAIKMHEYRSSSELNLAIWHEIGTHAKKYFERKNTIGWSEAGQLQMDQSPAVYFWSLVFAFSVVPACSWVPLFQHFR